MSSADADRVRALWRELTDAPGAFASADPVIVASDTHRASPAGWIGIVEVCGRVVVACPTAAAERVAEQLAGTTTEQLIEPRFVDGHLHPVDTLGPALLFYGRGTIPRATTAGRVVGPLDVDDPRVRTVIADASMDERDEAATGDTTSGVYVGFTPDGTPAAVCGWRVWPQRVAHIAVLTAASCRGLGHGASTAGAALDAATNAGLLPQWRAARSNQASIALARRLGLELLGHQYSVRLN